MSVFLYVVLYISCTFLRNWFKHQILLWDLNSTPGHSKLFEHNFLMGMGILRKFKIIQLLVYETSKALSGS